MRRRAPRGDLEKFLGAFSPEIAKVALRVRAFVLEQAPLAHELIRDADADAADVVAMGYSFTERPGDAFCHIVVNAESVDLGFDDGARLADPRRLLKGSGRRARFLRIAELDDLRQPHVGRFLRAAIQDREKKP